MTDATFSSSCASSKKPKPFRTLSPVTPSSPASGNISGGEEPAPSTQFPSAIPIHVPADPLPPPPSSSSACSTAPPPNAPPQLSHAGTSSTTNQQQRGGGGGGAAGGGGSYYAATNYKASNNNNNTTGIGLGAFRRRSETTQALLVPSLLCGILGPICWVLGSTGWPLHYALWASLLIVLSITQLRERLRRTAKLEAERIAFRKRNMQEDETAEWLNVVFFRIWQFHEPLLSSKLRDSFLEMLNSVRPSRIQSFEITRFTLGKKSPFISSARIITRHALFGTKTAEDKIVLHMQMGFQAPDLEVVILAKTSMGTIPIKIKDFWLQGRMRCEMDLVPKYPHIQTASFTFLETPLCDFDLQPMGVSMMEVPYLAALVQNQIVHGINEHMLDPARIVFNLIEQVGETEKVEAAEGVMFVTVREVCLPPRGAGSNLVLLGGGGCEYYCKLQVGEEMMFTREVQEVGGGEEGEDGFSPRTGRPSSGRGGFLLDGSQQQASGGGALSFGGETFAFLCGGNVTSSDVLELQLKQKRVKTSRTVSTLQVPLEEVIAAATAASESASAGGGGGGGSGNNNNYNNTTTNNKGTTTGKTTTTHQRVELEGQGGTGWVDLTLRYQLLPELVLEQTQATVIHRVNERTLSPVNAKADGVGLLKSTDHPHAGSLVLILHKGEELPPVDVRGVADPYAVVFYGEREVFRTKKAPTKTLSPEWEQSKEFTIYDLRKVKLCVRVFDTDEGLGEKHALADLDLDINAVLASEEVVNFGRKVTRIHKRYFRLRKPGPVTEKKEMTAADLKQARKGEAEAPAKGKTYGFLCISLLFRPLPASTVPRGHIFRASVGNEDDDALLSCYGVATTTTNMSNTKQGATGGLAGTTTLGVSFHHNHHQQQQQIPPISGRTQHTAAAHLSRTGGEKEKEKEKESYFSRFFSRPQQQQQQQLPRTSRNSVEGEQEEKYWQTKKGR